MHVNINFKAHVPCFARRRKHDKEFRLLIILTGSYLFYMYIHNKIGFWSLPVDLTYVTKLVEDCQKNLEYVKESVEDYRMVSTVLLEKAAPCNVLMYWAKHILQPLPPPPSPINRWFSVFKSILYNSKTSYFQHWSEKRKVFITYNITCSKSVEH